MNTCCSWSEEGARWSKSCWAEIRFLICSCSLDCPCICGWVWPTSFCCLTRSLLAASTVPEVWHPNQDRLLTPSLIYWIPWTTLSCRWSLGSDVVWSFFHLLWSVSRWRTRHTLIARPGQSQIAYQTTHWFHCSWEPGAHSPSSSRTVELSKCWAWSSRTSSSEPI